MRRTLQLALASFLGFMPLIACFDDKAQYALKAEDAAAMQPEFVEAYAALVDPSSKNPHRIAGVTGLVALERGLVQGDYRLVPYLCGLAASHPNPVIRSASIEALRPFLPNYSRAKSSLTSSKTEQIKPQLEMAVNTVIQATQDPEARVREAAAASLQVIRRKEALDAALRALKDTSGTVRFLALTSMAYLRDLDNEGKAREAVQQVVNDPDSEVRKAAAKLLENWDRRSSP